MVQAAPDEVLRAIGQMPSDLDWPTIAPNVVPAFPRRRPLPPGIGRPVEVFLPPGVMTGFAIDIGPAVMDVGQDIVRTWGIDTGELTAQALQNLRGLTRSVRPRDLLDDSVEGTPIRLLQSGEGWSSTLLLVEDELVRLFGDGDQRFIAPMRDLLISLPLNGDPAFARWLNEELAAMDPNALALDAFTLTGGQLRYEPLGRAMLPA